MLFYILLTPSLTHTPTDVTAYAARVRSLPLTCFPCYLFPFLQLMAPRADRKRLHAGAHTSFALQFRYGLAGSLKPIWLHCCANTQYQKWHCRFTHRTRNWPPCLQRSRGCCWLSFPAATASPTSLPYLHSPHIWPVYCLLFMEKLTD